jgi:hypothetical protein
VSREVDIFIKGRPDLSTVIDGALGERSSFHAKNNFFVDAIDETVPLRSARCVAG